MLKEDSDYQPKDFDLTSFLKRLKKDVTGAADLAREAAEHLEGGYHAKLREVIAAGYALARALAKDKVALASFVERPFFTRHGQHRPRIGTHAGEILMVAYRYIFNARTPQLRDRCMKYSAALRPSLEKGLDASSIPSLIEKAGGIDKLYAQAVKDRKAAQEAQDSDDGNDANSQDDADEGGDDQKENGAEGETTPPIRLATAAHKVSSPSISRPQDLVVEIAASSLETVLETHKEDRVRLVVRNLGRKSDGWVRFRAVKVAVLPRKDQD
jgi:hypothetical protein